MTAVLVAAVFALHATAQETVERVIKDPNRPGYAETFTVLKSKKSIKHGPYIKVNGEAKVVASGFFKQNKKDSTWEEYNYNGSILLSRGKYFNDEKVGVWEYYSYGNGEEQKYDYSTKQLVYYKPKAGDSLYLVYEGDEIKQMRLDQPPVLIGGSPVVQNTLLRNLRYPDDAIRARKTGVVVVAFDVNTDGSIGNYQVKRQVHSSLDREALRVVKMIPHHWVPGIKDGQKVKVQIQQPVMFRLD